MAPHDHDYIDLSRLKEVITCDLFCALDDYAAERRKRALRLDAIDASSESSPVSPGPVWLVGPELSGAKQEAEAIAERFVSRGWEVHLVSRLDPDEWEFPGQCKVVLHHVKPLESYAEHVGSHSRVVAFFLPLCASLAEKEIKTICLLSSQDSAGCPGKAAWIPDFTAGYEVVGRKALPPHVESLERLLSRKTPPAPRVPYVPTLSACLIAKDEEGMIEGCLSSLVPFADETIVNDTGSKDATVAIAESYGAKVIRTEWRNDFAGARNDSLSQARCSHILVIDADERVVKETAGPAKAGLMGKCDGWHVQVENSLSRGTNHIRLLRLFRNKPYHRFSGNIHEQVAQSIRGATADSPLQLYHLGYDPVVVAVRQKRQRNIDLLLEQAKTGTALHPAYLDFQAATEMLLSGSYKDAAALFCKVLDETPPATEFRPHAGVSACRALVQMEAIDEAHSLALRLLDDYPGFIEPAEVAAEPLMKRGSYEAAEHLLAEAAKVKGSAALPKSDGADTYRFSTLMALLRLGTGKPGEAFGFVVEALRAYPEYDVAQTLLVTHWPEKAAGVLREVSATSAKPAAMACLRTGKRDLAREVAESIGDDGALGEIHLAAREFTDAAKRLSQSVDAWDQCRVEVLSACGLAPGFSFQARQPLVRKVLSGEPCGISELDMALKVLGFLIDVGAMREFSTGLGSLEAYGEQKQVFASSLLSERGHIEEAYAEICKASDTPDHLPVKADLARRLGKLADSAAYYALLGTMRPLTAHEYVRFVDCLVKSGQLALAKEAAASAAATYPVDPTVQRLSRILGVQASGT